MTKSASLRRRPAKFVPKGLRVIRGGINDCGLGGRGTNDSSSRSIGQENRKGGGGGVKPGGDKGNMKPTIVVVY
jgi:hypothetical protein